MCYHEYTYFTQCNCLALHTHQCLNCENPLMIIFCDYYITHRKVESDFCRNHMPKVVHTQKGRDATIQQQPKRQRTPAATIGGLDSSRIYTEQLHQANHLAPLMAAPTKGISAPAFAMMPPFPTIEVEIPRPMNPSRGIWVEGFEAAAEGQPPMTPWGGKQDGDAIWMNFSYLGDLGFGQDPTTDGIWMVGTQTNKFPGFGDG